MRGTYTMSLLCLAAIALLVGFASAMVDCDSTVSGEHMGASVDYMEEYTDQTNCQYSAVSYTQKMSSRGGNYTSYLTGGEGKVTHDTSADVTGTYRDAMFSMQNVGCDTESPCCDNEECDDLYYERSEFSMSGMGDKLNIQSSGSIDTKSMYGESSISGDGSGKISAKSNEMTIQKNSEFSYKVRAGGKDFTTKMRFSWAR